MKWYLSILLLFPIALSAQNIGVNIDSPAFQLDVRAPTSDQLTFLNVASQDNAYFTRLIAGHPGSPASSLSWRTGSELNLGMWDQDNFIYSLVMHLSPLNRVGINTFEPGFDLDVRGLDNTWDGGELQLATPGQTNFLRFFGGRLGDQNPFMAFADTDTFHIVSTAPNWLTFTRRMTMLPTGEVGFGTEEPQAKVDIHGIGDGTELLRFTTDRPWVFRQTSSGVATKLTLQSTVNSKMFEILSSDSTNRAAVFHSHDVHSNVLLVPDGGEVGIGVEDPLAKLHVLHNSNTGWPQLRLTEDDFDYSRIWFENSANPGVNFTIAARPDTTLSESKLNFYYAGPNGAGDRMTILGNGNVGIGTSNPIEKLHVNGTFRVNDLAGTGDRNVIVDGSGKFKIGTVGVGDTDWNETSTHVITQKIARVATVTGTPPFTTGNWIDVSAGAINKWTQIGTSSPYGTVLNLQNDHTGDINMVSGGGQVGIGINAGGSKLTIEGPDNNGSVAGLEIHSPGGSQVLLLDGNEIDAATNLHFNANSGQPVSIGTLQIASGYKLSVAGKIIAEEVRVQLQGAWPDYVFSDDYKLLPLKDVEASIRENGHLPGIPAASQVEEEGLDVGDMQTRMMEKIEELTLYIIDVNKKVDLLQQENEELKAALENPQK